jgi:hypothetical protein
MNRKNAVYVIHDDLVTIDVTFEYATCRELIPEELNELVNNYLNQRIKTHTYCALQSWLPENLSTGDLVLVPAKKDFTAARFVNLGGVENLDLDTFQIEYKWILGFLPQALLDQYQAAIKMNEDILQRANVARAEAIRVAVKQQLFLENK